MNEKFKANLWIALPAALVTLLIYVMIGARVENVSITNEINPLLVLPYIIIIVTAVIGINVTVVLALGIVSTLLIALINGYAIFDLFGFMGKGIDSMIPVGNSDKQSVKMKESKTKNQKETTEAVKTGITTLDINLVEPNKEQPRKQFNADRLQELSDSIKQHGIVEPLVVVKKKDYYEIVAGERESQERNYFCGRCGHHALPSARDGEVERKIIFHGVSGSDECVESYDHYRRSDCRGGTGASSRTASFGCP